MTDAPFAPHRHDLGDAVALVPIPPEAVDELARRTVAIDPWARLGVAAAAMAVRIAAPSDGARRFAITRAGAIVGWVSIRHPFMRGPYLETIALFPEARRGGIARRVIDWMGREVAGREADLWLCVTEWNDDARAAYRALGFEEVGRLPDLVAPGVCEIFMRKRLPRGADRPAAGAN